MTQNAEQQKQELAGAAERVADKLLTFHAGLPADEQAVLDLAFARLVSGEQEAIGEEVDARGHMIAQYDDGQGYKGPPQPVTGTGGGGGFPDRFAHNVITLFGPLVWNFPWPSL